MLLTARGEEALQELGGAGLADAAIDFWRVMAGRLREEARAMLDGRHYFTHADVMAVAPAVLGHRLIIRPEAEVEGKRTSDVVRELLDSVPVLQE